MVIIDSTRAWGAVCAVSATAVPAAERKSRRLKTESPLKAQHFPQPLGETLRHPLEAQVVGVSAVHQPVHAKGPEQVSSLHQLEMEVAGGYALTHDLADQGAHLLVLAAAGSLGGRVNGCNRHHRRLGVAFPQDADERVIDLAQRICVTVVLGKVEHESGRIDLGDGARHGGLAPAVSGEAQVDMVEIEAATEDRLVAHARTAGAASLSDRRAIEDERLRNG